MDLVSRAGLTAFFAFVLALVSGYAGAVAIPQGPDNVNLHASQGIDLTSRASKWEFQQAADRLQARGGFGVGGKGMGFAGNVIRNIGRAELINGALGASRLLGGWAGAASLLAPIIWDAINQRWFVPGVPGPDQTQSLIPGGPYDYGGPFLFQGENNWTQICDSGRWQGPQDGKTWAFVFLGPRGGSAPTPGAVYWTPCNAPGHDKPGQGLWISTFVKGTSRSNACVGLTAVFSYSTGECLPVGGGREPTDDEFRTALAGGLDANPPAGAGLAGFLHDSGAPFEAGDPYAEGPAHIDGPTQTDTSTSDAGTTTTQTQRAWDMAYQGRDVSVKETETTTTTDEAGNTTTRETTHEVAGGDAPPADGSGGKGNGTDLCVDHPDASACASLDSPDDQELDRDDRSAVFSYVSVAGSCPADRDLVWFGHSFPISYAPMCSVVSSGRPIVVGIALLFAALFVVRIVRGGGS